MRIAFVCNEYPPGPHGGIGTVTRVLARGLVGSGHEVRVVGVYPRDYPGAAYEEDAGVRVWRLRARRVPGGWIAARLRLLRFVRAWIRRGEIDLVELPDYEGWAAGWRSLAVPVVVRLNGSTTYFARELGQTVGAMTFRLEKASLMRADFWCSSSEYTARKTREVFGLEARDVPVLYNPVEDRNGASGSRSRSDVVYSGTLTQKKGVVSLIDAWRRVVARVPAARLHVYGKDGAAAGGGSMREHLRARLPEACRESVLFHGHVDREVLHEALAAARLAVFPSYAEAFALAPLEAMRTGCPTIFSRRGAGPELIRDGVDGLLIEPDRPEEIAEAIARLLQDDALADRLGAAGRARVRERFSLPRLLPENESFYAACVASKARAGDAR